MVAINLDVDESASIELAEPIDAVGQLRILTHSSGITQSFNTGTATLVTPNKILTAAHVIDTDRDGIIDVEDISQYSFLLGDNLEENADYELKISDVSLHPSWSASEANRVTTVDDKEVTNSQYDLAVLTLSSDFTDVEAIPLSPTITELANNTSLLGRKATIVGFGKFGSPNATRTNNGTRYAAENIIDSADNGLIRFDYDSTFSHQQTDDTGLNHPNIDGSQPDLIPVPNSSPLPISLEGGIGEGDSGGPLLVKSDLGVPIIAGVASKFIDTEAIGLPFSGYGSVYVYSSLNDPETLEFLNAENIIDADVVENVKASDNILPTIEEFLAEPSLYISEIRDYDGNDFDFDESWKNLGSVDIQGDGDEEHIFVNSAIGRWGTVGDISGIVNFANYGEGGDTRVVGIYEDPMVTSGEVESGSAFDSQQRFQNDLLADNFTLLDGDDYDNDGAQEIYLGLKDGSAVLHAYMFPDGNIQYANYQSAEDLEQFMTDNNIDSSVWSDWI